MSVNVKENGLLKNVEKKFRPKTFATFAAEHFKLGPSDKKLYLSDEVSAKISHVDRAEKDGFISRNLWSLGDASSSSDTWAIQYVKFSIKAGTYYISYIGNKSENDYVFIFYDIDGVEIARTSKGEITLTRDGYRMSLWINTGSATNIQLEKGNKQTEYTPYAKSNAELTQLTEKYSNPNILDNGWFNFINGNRFYKWETGNYTMSGNAIHFESTQYVIQYLPQRTKDLLDGKTCTISIKYLDGTLNSSTFVYEKNATWKQILRDGRMAVDLFESSGDIALTGLTTCNVVAIKLEEGSVSTLSNDSGVLDGFTQSTLNALLTKDFNNFTIGHYLVSEMETNCPEDSSDGKNGFLEVYSAYGNEFLIQNYTSYRGNLRATRTRWSGYWQSWNIY